MNKQVEYLINKKQYTQKTPEWYLARENIITASSAASLLSKSETVCKEYVNKFCLENSFSYDNKCCNPYSNKLSYIKAKAGLEPSSFTGNTATFWGQKYEQIASDIYSLIKGEDVMEFGLIIHDKYDWIGASPDGITPSGRMLEIKCPSRRKITGIPPLYYWIQVQLQLEVCNLDVCDFFECEFVEYLTYEEFLDDTLDDHIIYFKGIIFQKGEDETYIYPNKNCINDIEQINAQIKQNPNYKVIYWKLINFSNVSINREVTWFSNILQILNDEYKYIQEIKNNPDLLASSAPSSIFD